MSKKIEEDKIYSYRIKPDKLLDNNRLSEMFKELHNYKTIWERKKWPEDNLLPSLKLNQIGWEIKITRDNAYFYFTTSNKEDKDIVQRALSTSTITDDAISLDELKTEPKMFLTNELELNYHYFLSLSTNIKEFEPLASILDMQKLLKDEEYVIVQYIFRPDSYDWSTSCSEAYEKFKSGSMPRQFRLDKKELALSAAKGLAMVGLGVGELIQGLILDDSESVEKYSITDNGVAKILKDSSLSKATMSKAKHNAFITTMRLIVKSTKEDRKEQLMRGLNVCFNTVRQDNYLVPHYIETNETTIKNIMDRKASISLVKNILTTEEVTKLCLLPQITLQNTYKMDSIETREVTLPKELLSSRIPIGTACKNGKVYDVGWETKRDIVTLPKVIIGGMGSGKSKFTTSFVVGAAMEGHGAFVFDFIGECKLARELEQLVPSNKLVSLDISDIKNPFSLAYNEVQITDDMSRWEKIKNASDLAEQTAYLINALNDGNAQPLTAAMSKTLYSACMITYTTGRTKVYDVINVLSNYKIRREVINDVISKGIYKLSDNKISDVLELDDVTAKGTVIGTKYNKIEYIMDRLDILLRNPYLEMMAMADIDERHNFVDYMNQGKIVLIKIPESTFKKKWVKDVIITYFLSRIWMCALIRGDDSNKKVFHVVTDEIHQIPTAAKLVSDTITESRKFGLGYYFTCQFLGQFKILLDGVKGAGASYMLLAGTEKENHKLLREECGEFTYEDLQSLKQYTSLNIIKTSKGIITFISTLPTPKIKN